MKSYTRLKPPKEQAVALFYDKQHAPTVIAKGDDELAQQIIEIAKEHDIPLRAEPELVALLAQVELGEQIPRELYVAVAEILAFIYRINDDESSKDSSAKIMT